MNSSSLSFFPSLARNGSGILLPSFVCPKTTGGPALPPGWWTQWRIGWQQGSRDSLPIPFLNKECPVSAVCSPWGPQVTKNSHGKTIEIKKNKQQCGYQRFGERELNGVQRSFRAVKIPCMILATVDTCHYTFV